jgi:hypothetical protein
LLTETADPELSVALIYSPILPAVALSFVDVPKNCPLAATVLTYAVVAILVELSPAVWVVVVGEPARAALEAICVPVTDEDTIDAPGIVAEVMFAPLIAGAFVETHAVPVYIGTPFVTVDSAVKLVAFPIGKPLTVVVSVIAGAVVLFATVPLKPLVVTTEAFVTVPLPPPPPTADNTPAPLLVIVVPSPRTIPRAEPVATGSHALLTVPLEILDPFNEVKEAPEPVALSRGPTVEPLMRAKAPLVVVHRSPLTGEVGAVPWGRFKLAAEVVDAVPLISPLTVKTPALVKVICDDPGALPFHCQFSSSPFATVSIQKSQELVTWLRMICDLPVAAELIRITASPFAAFC